MSQRTLPSSLQPSAYAILRIVGGGMFFIHGLQKIFGMLGGTFQPPFGSQIWVGGVLELVLGLLIAVGLFTRVAAFIACGEMAVAYIQFHWKLQLAGYKWVPAVNQGELAVVYCFLFLFVFAAGPGIASLDARFRRVPVNVR